MTAKDLRASWPQALLVFLSPMLVIMTVRWLLIEPYVIPSGSMIPTLLIHDNMLVNKLKYGIKVPFGNSFLIRWSQLERGDVVVFRWPENPNTFFVKRVVGLGGDEITIEDGVLSINGVASPQEVVEGSLADDNEYAYFRESFSETESHVIRYQNKENSQFASVKVPEGSFFVIGDNRDSSNDSRFWGAVPEQNLVGKASIVWLSCEQTLSSARFLCDPKTLRRERMFKSVR